MYSKYDHTAGDKCFSIPKSSRCCPSSRAVRLLIHTALRSACLWMNDCSTRQSRLMHHVVLDHHCTCLARPCLLMVKPLGLPCRGHITSQVPGVVAGHFAPVVYVSYMLRWLLLWPPTAPHSDMVLGCAVVHVVGIIRTQPRVFVDNIGEDDRKNQRIGCAGCSKGLPQTTHANRCVHLPR